MNCDGKGFTTVQKSQGTDRLLRPRRGRGFSEKCGVSKLSPPKKIITNESCTPSWQYIAILKIHPPPPIPSRPSLFFHPCLLYTSPSPRD